MICIPSTRRWPPKSPFAPRKQRYFRGAKGDYIAVVALALVAVLAGCRKQTPPSPARPVAIIASGDTHGWLVPCGCTSNQSGGLPRRASYIDSLKGQFETIVVDVGGAPGGTSEYDKLRFEAILRGESEMSVCVHNIGAAEAALGADYLRSLEKSWPGTFLSTNLRDEQGKLVAEGSQSVQSCAGPPHIVFFGVLSERYARPGLRIDPPREAVLSTLSRLRNKSVFKIVLAYMDDDELGELARALPEVDAVIGGPTRQPLPPDKIKGAVLVLSATNKGKFLARVDVPGDGKAWTGQIVELDQRFADNKEQLKNVAAFRKQLAERDITAQQTSFVDATALADDTIAGTKNCRECHAEEDRLWRASGHAHAWQSLEKQGAHVDPECQRCHTTGYGLAGGFVSARRSAERVDVGCESCHGPSERHVKDAKQRTTRYQVAKDRCRACHDAENSPQFDLEEYWKKIEHGVK